MEGETENEATLIKYLLGELREEEQSRIEERYFIDKGYRLELQAAERDLIDSYVLDELPMRERDQFEKYFMRSPARRERVEFAMALARSLSSTSTATLAADSSRGSVSWWDSLLIFVNAKCPTLALAAVIMVATIGGLWLVLTLKNQTSQETGDDTTRQRNSPPQVLEQPSSKPPQPTHEAHEPERAGGKSSEPKQSTAKPSSRMATFVLTPDLARGGAEAKDIVIPRGKVIIRFQVGFEAGEHKDYQFALLTPEGERVWNDKRVMIKTTEYGKVAFLEVPARILAGGDYVLKLSGVTANGESKDIGKYYFKVVKK